MHRKLAICSTLISALAFAPACDDKKGDAKKDEKKEEAKKDEKKEEAKKEEGGEEKAEGGW
jgi:ribosomal protein L12E/L44/L45/RPP1/RPP2